MIMVIFYYGEDTFTLAREIKKLKANFSGEIHEVSPNGAISDTALRGRLVEIFSNQGLFSSKKMVFLKNFVDQAKDFPKTEEYLLALAKNPPADHELIFAEEESCDKRLKFFKALQKLAQTKEFNLLSYKNLEIWIESILKTEGFTIEPDAAITLGKLFGADEMETTYSLWQVNSELEKLMLFKEQEKVIHAADVKELVKPNISHNVFSLTNLFAEGKGAEAMRLLEKMMGEGPASDLKSQSIQIIGGLASQIRSLLLVKDLETESSVKIAARLGWKEGRVWINSKLAKKFAKEKLVKLLADLRALDLRLKTSEEPPKLLLSLFLQKAKV